jgi:hypothetical protein
LTAGIVNLRRARKASRRKGEAKQADENRIRHGRTKTERARAAAEKKRADSLIAGHRREID